MAESQYQIPLERTANQPITEGVHPFTIVGVDEGEGPKGPYWKFTMRCDTPSEEGKTLLHFVSLTDQSRWRLEIFLDAVGAPGKGNATVDKFLNRRLRGNVVHQDYEGRAQARIQEMYPISQETAEAKPAAAVVKKVTAAKTAVKATQLELPADAAGEEIPF